MNKISVLPVKTSRFSLLYQRLMKKIGKDCLFLSTWCRNKQINTRLRRITGMISFIVFLGVFFLYLLPAVQELSTLFIAGNPNSNSGIWDENGYLRYKTAKQKEIHTLQQRLEGISPKQPYLVINTSENTFYLYKKGTRVNEGICSTGSYVLLEAGDNQKWIFKTPRGAFRIQGKTHSPVWKKPDWAFVEEGLPIPPAHHPSRYEYGVLGDYALSIGDGYLIHGTLYKRFLGLPATHGCIRLNDEDLEQVYLTLNPGNKVFIY